MRGCPTREAARSHCCRMRRAIWDQRLRMALVVKNPVAAAATSAQTDKNMVRRMGGPLWVNVGRYSAQRRSCLRGLAAVPYATRMDAIVRGGPRRSAGSEYSAGVVTAVTMLLMARTQVGARIDEDVLELAKARAKDRGQSVGEYLSQLVLEDADGLRARGLDAARRFLDEHQDVFDEVEDGGRAATEAHAA